MAYLEEFVKRPGNEWETTEEISLIDMLGAIENAIKAQLSVNIPDYEG